MKNVLLYYYNLVANELVEKNNYNTFSIDGINYIFELTERSEKEIAEIYEISLLMYHNGIPCHNIINNKLNKLITIVDGKQYVLLKNNINSNDKISLYDVVHFSVITKMIYNFGLINKSNWKLLWQKKIDYMEYAMKNLENNDLFISGIFNYLVGITENAIQAFNQVYNEKYNNFSISHNRVSINMSLNEFYNPLNFIIDISSRDVSEYFKSKLWLYNIDVIDELKYVIENNLYNDYEKKMMLVRLIYPSHQLDLYEYLFKKRSYIQSLTEIFMNNYEFELQIKKMYKFCQLYISDCPLIGWFNY